MPGSRPGMTAKLGDTVKENIRSAFVLKFPKILGNR
jgi:hypothetical protein